MRRTAIALAFILALILGMTAGIWNPITRAYDQMTTSWESATHQGQRVDDSAHPMTAQECDEQGLPSALCDAIAEGEE